MPRMSVSADEARLSHHPQTASSISSPISRVVVVHLRFWRHFRVDPWLQSPCSRFLRGKSRSFTSRTEVSSSSTKDLAKPQNAYTRRRKYLLAFSINWDRHDSASLPPTRGRTPQEAGQLQPQRRRHGGPCGTAAPTAAESKCRSPAPFPGGSPPPRCHFSVRSLS
ncbi:unnamed protein product [Spirodela intermedia]|uniref:Uncharacterized protein n=1 Tax=Spirodela intermedia TaxID=51605 RepID=A0A7I8I9Z1_SPIIN|nr:unnamed protein product [Spirodela intermedia]CAA6654495.1 unnamed protein product [Spirodela intermedia]